jgi:hypothetical protein
VSTGAFVHDSQFEIVQSACATSMDSVLDLGGLDFLQRSKGFFCSLL